MQNPGMVLVLWTNYFDEVATTALVTAFRKSGIRVKLVGLGHGGAMGASGLTLVPDVRVSQNFRSPNRAVIMAGSSTTS